MRKKTSLLLMSMALYSCAQIDKHEDSSPTTSDTYSLLSLPRLLARAAPQPELSVWHRESLALCQIHGTELEDFTLPVSVNLWDRVRDGFRIEPEINQRVQQEIDWYSKHPAFLAKVSERAEKYLYFVVEEIEKRQLPLELALLPIVESGFDPFAYSPGSAAGMWQVVPGTGKMLGLKQNWWYDGRRDVVASTQAALTYLEQLHAQVGGDWLLALAAYNTGAGNIQRAVKKNQASGKRTDYWSLELPAETEMFIPRLLALKALVEKPEVYGMSLFPVPNEPYFAAVDVGSQIELSLAARWADMSTDDLAALNPGFNRWATDPDGPHTLLFPRKKAPLFIARLEEVPAEQRTSWSRYKTKSGDTLASIAKRHGTSVAQLQSLNGISGNSVTVGATVLVPRMPAGTQKDMQMADAGQPINGSKVQYLVQQGDSLWGISRKFKVTLQQLAEWNGMAKTASIFPGQRLVIWQKANTTQATPGGERAIRKLAYKIREGDSLADIAGKFKVEIADITTWNQVAPGQILEPGDHLTLFVDVTRVQ